jgi:DMSO/TMAO reductase YedYZ molybdopterin-dependent catalytic subunit
MMGQKMTRRELMALAGGTVVSIGLPGTFIKLMDSENIAMAAELRADGRPRIPPGQHAVKALTDMGGVSGSGDMKGWQLKITGEVEAPTVLSYQKLLALEGVDLTCDVHCVTGWTLLDSKWRGVIVLPAGPCWIRNGVGFGWKPSWNLSRSRKMPVL